MTADTGTTASTVIEYIRYRIPEERSAEFLAAYTGAAAQLAASPHCVDYELARCEEDFAHFVLRITWTSTQDHLEGFRTSDLFPAFLAEIRPYIADIEEMRHYKPTSVRGRGSAVPTLYTWAGGAEAFSRLTEAFYAKVVKDDLLAPVFEGLAPEHAEHVALWLTEVFGGPRPTRRPRAATVTWSPSTSDAASPSPSAAAGSASSRTPPTRPACPPTPSSARRSSPTSSGAPAWPSTSPAPTQNGLAEQPVPLWNWGAAPPYQG